MIDQDPIALLEVGYGCRGDVKLFIDSLGPLVSACLPAGDLVGYEFTGGSFEHLRMFRSGRLDRSKALAILELGFELPASLFDQIQSTAGGSKYPKSET